ncbi:hypothetical protein ACLMJK_003505 [Lecanora helva]
MEETSSTERPRTPPQSSEVGTQGLEPKVRQQSGRKPIYSGHITDLIYPLQNAVSAIKWQIPDAYCEAEAVDSSLLLGQGASFSASLQRLPTGAEKTEHVVNLGGVTITKRTPSAPRPKFVVYKSTQIAFAEDGLPLPEYRRAMRSVLTEFHALIYPPLMRHLNVIDFLGFAWGSNPFSSFQKLPAIVVEYAEHGTLTNLFVKNPNVSSTQRQFLALDIAQGLLALHQTGLIHGDVKADNALICPHPDRQYIAKIADFGFSIVQETENENIPMGGTRPWMAPEVLKGPVPVQILPKTDIFSFGLLCWVIFLGGANPIDCFSADQSTSKAVHFEKIKADGLLLQAALNAQQWLECYAHVKYDQNIERALDASIAKVKAGPAKPNLNAEQMQKNRPLLRKKMFSQMLSTLMKNTFLVRLIAVFKDSLQLQPGGRNLEAIITELKVDLPSFESVEAEKEASKSNASSTVTKDSSRSDTRPEKPVHPNSDNFSGNSKNHVLAKANNENESALPPVTWTEQGFMRNWLSWQKMKELAPSVQNFVYSALTEDRPANLFLLSALHMVGYGCSKDTEKSLHYLRRSAEMENFNARSNLFRIHSAFLPADTDPSTIPGREYLYDYAANGSRMAMVELCRVASPDERERCRRYMADATGGVGASWLNSDQMLNGFTQSQWIKDDWSMEKISQVESPADLIVNQRGDTILHFTAMCGRRKPFKALVETYNVDINIRNPLGETPTLVTCRSGHGGIAILCLQKYRADTSLAAINGETPLHWLCQFDDEYIEPIVKDLIARGAVIEAATRERVMHSHFPGTMDMDFVLPGTPLHWAVHRNRPHIVSVLLKHGANPEYTAPGAVQSPLAWAAYWHNHECLKIIIEHQESKVTAMTTEGKPDLRHAVLFGPLVQSAIKAADKFSMILRHGIEWLTCLHKTLDLLREKTKMIDFSTQFRGSALQYAVEGAHDEVVDYMFQHEWLIDTINKPIGDAQRTPLLEAVRWNRKPMCELLRDKGADVKALAANPFQPERKNWSALHILAHEGHDKDISLAEWLIRNGVPIDGRKGTHESTSDTNISSLTLDDLKAGIYSCETAFAVAVRRNAFNLANELLRLGADPSTLSFSSGMFASSHPLITLGHLIISNARYSIPRLKYILNVPESIDFIVEPERKLTALHRAAMANQDTLRAHNGEEVHREDFDFETNAEIMRELLTKWKDPKSLNAKCLIKGNTALHLAVSSHNANGVVALLHAGADAEVLNDDKISPRRLAEEMAVSGSGFEDIIKAFK